jgi:ribosomal protein S18 acetylase RimI-like enzyme
MEITIIKAESKHLNDCAASLLKSDLGAIYFSDESRAYKALTDGISKGELSVALNDNSECLGFIWIIPNGAFKFPYIHIVAVKEEYRSLGIGKLLLGFFEERAAQYTSKAFLVVADFNPRAKKLYESIGYNEVGAIPGLYKEGVTEFLMMKEFK